MRLKPLSALLLACATLGTANAAANLINNGTFESYTGSFPANGFLTLMNGSTALTGWTVAGTSVDLVQQPNFGGITGVSVDLLGSPGPGSISQSFATVAGFTYTLDLDYSHNGASSSLLYVNLGSAPQQMLSVATTGHDTYSWVASSTGTAFLTLAATGTGNMGPVVDNVVLTAVPEPATTGLALAGLLAIGAFKRSRKT